MNSSISCRDTLLPHPEFSQVVVSISPISVPRWVLHRILEPQPGEASPSHAYSPTQPRSPYFTTIVAGFCRRAACSATVSADRRSGSASASNCGSGMIFTSHLPGLGLHLAEACSPNRGLPRRTRPTSWRRRVRRDGRWFEVRGRFYAIG